MFGLYVATAASLALSCLPNYEEEIKNIKKKYKESRNFPRKKKKRVRKILQLDYGIATYMSKQFDFETNINFETYANK